MTRNSTYIEFRVYTTNVQAQRTVKTAFWSALELSPA